MTIDELFGMDFVERKRKSESYIKSGNWWSQRFPEHHEIVQLIVNAENRWDKLQFQSHPDVSYPEKEEKLTKNFGNMLDLEMEVHCCVKCTQTTLLQNIVYYPPVFSFGEHRNKEIFVIGLNPSAREYINGYLSDSSDIYERRESQLTYFDKRRYRKFEHDHYCI